MRKLFCLLGILLVLLVFCSGCTTTVSQRSYTNTTYGFSLDPPTGWSVVENVSPMAAVRCAPPGESNDASLAVDAPVILSEGLALSTFADHLEELFSENTKNFSVVSRGETAIGGLNAYEITCFYEVNQTVFHLKQVAVLKTRTVFIITFVAMSDLYSTDIAAVDECIDSFLIT